MRSQPFPLRLEHLIRAVGLHVIHQPTQQSHNSMQLRILELKETDKLVSQLQLIPILAQNVPFLAFIILHTFGLMVLSDLGRLVPALRRALMLAYRPGFDLFICTLYHTPTPMPFVFLIHAQGCFGSVGGKADSGSLFPSPLQIVFLYVL